MPGLPMRIPDLLLPADNVDLYRWSVIACDQFTSVPSYWKKAESLVGKAPSTLRVILPEYTLPLSSESDIQEALDSISHYSNLYLEQGTLQPLKNTLLVVERTLPGGLQRRGILLQIDLAAYSSDPADNLPIKATEAIVESRLPRRIQARKSSTLDIPHILMLYSDPANVLLPKLLKAQRDLCYETELMLGGGSVRAHSCESAAATDALHDFFNEPPASSVNAQLVAGDGNHALMSAKKVWLERGARADDPERWALVELVNIFDAGLEIKPIHRLLFDANIDQMLEKLSEHGRLLDEEKFLNLNEKTRSNAARVYTENLQSYWIAGDTSVLTVEALEALFQESTGKFKSVDFIHSSAEVLSMARQGGNIGFIAPDFNRDLVFTTVHARKLFQRKVFSIGEAEEKRYYLECCLRR